MFARKNSTQPNYDSDLIYDAGAMPRVVIRRDGQELRMLLIEDQPSDVALAEEMLEDSMPDYQWSVVSKTSMGNALLALDHAKFDVALVDLSLPDMQGEETIATLRMAAPDLPIVIYSGTGDMDMLHKAMLNGAQFCIEKGTTMPKVVRAMIQCVLSPEAHY